MHHVHGRHRYTKATDPGDINFTRAATNYQIARVKETRTATLESYNTQEGARAGLRKVIIADVPAKLLVVPEDAESGLDEVKPSTLLKTIEARAAPVTCVDAKTLKTVRDTSVIFDTEDPLATQFAVTKKAIADLCLVHGITTIEMEL